LNIFARGENNKGITMYSLFDGAVVTNMTKMHTNYIETFLVTNDSNTIVTAGKDKKIKIWDWIK
jgi:WD40 repeat protein